MGFARERVAPGTIVAAEVAHWALLIADLVCLLPKAELFRLGDTPRGKKGKAKVLFAIATKPTTL